MKPVKQRAAPDKLCSHIPIQSHPEFLFCRYPIGGQRNIVPLAALIGFCDKELAGRDLHFSDEEAITRAVKLSFAKHKQEHETVLKVLCFIRDEIADKNNVWSEDSSKNYAEILRDWLSTHILMEDMLMKPVLQTCPYDFKPHHRV